MLCICRTFEIRGNPVWDFIQHEAGYICAMLFIIPGFPFITSGIDLAKLDMRSGMERLTYALIIVLVATMSAWIMAMLLHLSASGFHKDPYVCCNVDPHTACCKLFRRVRFFHHV